MGARNALIMRSPTGHSHGFTSYQLLVSAVLIVILGALALAFTKQKVIKQQMQSTVQVVRHG